MERTCDERVSKLVLMFATESLVAQITDYLRHHELGLTVCRWSQSAIGSIALDQADLAIADATKEPEAAIQAFEIASAVLGSHYVLTYTEVMHEGLELFVRTRGGLLLLGPMCTTEWGGHFQGVLRRPRKRAPFLRAFD